LATSDALKLLDKSTDILFIGQTGGMESKLIPAAGLKFAGIKAGKFRRMYSASWASKLLNLKTIGPNTRDVGRTAQGVAMSLKILRRFQPDVVFAKGGFVALPVGLAARILKIPLVIHESDVEPGIGSRVLGRWADKIAVGFPERYYREFPKDRLVFTGNPVRSEITVPHRLEGLARFGFSDSLPVVLVTGGSSGSREVNDAVVSGLQTILDTCQLIHLTGEGEYEHVKFQVSRLGDIKQIHHYQPFGFLTGDMAMALSAADLVVSRAGANTIAELAALKKPTVLIPNTEMAGHQMMNAKVLARAGAARVLNSQGLTGEKLAGEIKRLVGDPEELERLGKRIGEFAKPDAARELAELILAAGRAEVQAESAEAGE
jgi:UDP-N-acetylglucosamine--N-acetylmuramyl-(pentapeptide) pyrophosphoryl-undecaprenol N-acetylglucosamine transferase